MRFRFLMLGVASIVLASAHGIAGASESPALSRSLTILHEMRPAGAVSTSVRGTIAILSPAGASALKAFRVSDYLAGGAAETFDAVLVRANGYEQVLRPAGPKAEIALPELNTGDVIRFQGMSRVAGLQFGGGFVASREFPASEGYQTVEITVSAPSLQGIRHDSRLFEVRSELNSEGESLHFVLKAQPARSPAADPSAVIQPLARYSLSSIATPEALNAVLAKGLAPREKPDAAISARAGQLVGAARTKLDEANALLDWVNASVKRDGQTLATASWPPSSASATHENLSGSALEIARLYQALLAARGIHSEMILSHRHDASENARVAVPDYDAVFLHMPELDLYTELTAKTPINSPLNPQFAGRPALRLASAGPQFLQFPPLRAATSKLQVISEMSVAANGGLTGQTRAQARGPVSALLQANIRKLAELAPAERNRSLLERQNMTGQAAIISAGMGEDGKDYTTEIDFRINGETGKDGSIAIPVFSGPRFIKAPHAAFIAALRDERDQPFRCFSEELSQNIVIHMPDAYPLPRLPGNIHVELANARYSAEYKFVGRALKVSRRLVLDLPSTICSREMARDMAPVLRAAARDMSRRIVIRGPED